MAELEDALLDYAFEFLLKTKKFQLIDVDDVLPLSTTQACGVIQAPNSHSIQYMVENLPGYCLSGTAGMHFLILNI